MSAAQKVKQLKWVGKVAWTPFGNYETKVIAASAPQCMLVAPYGSVPPGRFMNDEDAQAAAQIDFERRVNSCLEPVTDNG